MREILVHELIKCDLCGCGMGAETSGATLRHVPFPDGRYVEATVRVSTFLCGHEVSCLCTSCRKAILQNELQALRE